MLLKDLTMTRDEVKECFGIKETTLLKWVNQGRLPAPTYCGRRAVWFKDSIDKVIQAMRTEAERNLRKR